MSFARLESMGFVVNWCARVYERRMAEALRPLGLTPAYLPPLFILSEVGTSTQTELAAIAAISQPTMASTLRRMERDGLIVRVKDTTDSRRENISLTDRARELLPEVEAHGKSINQAATEGLSAHSASQLITMLRHTAENLEKAQPPKASRHA